MYRQACNCDFSVDPHIPNETVWFLQDGAPLHVGMNIRISTKINRLSAIRLFSWIIFYLLNIENLKNRMESNTITGEMPFGIYLMGFAADWDSVK